MAGFYLIIIAQLINTVVFIIDKHLLSDPLPHALANAFFVSLASISVLLLAPFGFSMLPLGQLIISLFAGVLITLALWALYHVFREADITEAAPAVGALTAIFTLLAGYALGIDSLSGRAGCAFILLVLGSLVLSARFGRRILSLDKYFLVMLLSSLCFGVSYALTKEVFNYTNFVNGFIWTRLGMVLGALLLLISPQARKQIFQAKKEARRPDIRLFTVSRGMSGLAYLMIFYAIKINHVSLVKAFDGLQFVFLLFFVHILAADHPEFINTQIVKMGLWQKISAIVFISSGLIILAI